MVVPQRDGTRRLCDNDDDDKNEDSGGLPQMLHYICGNGNRHTHATV